MDDRCQDKPFMFDENGVGWQALQLLFALYLYNYIMGQYVDPVR